MLCRFLLPARTQRFRCPCCPAYAAPSFASRPLRPSLHPSSTPACIHHNDAKQSWNPPCVFSVTECVLSRHPSAPAGIHYSDDKLLQTRIFSYQDTQRHRLGGARARARCPAAWLPGWLDDAAAGAAEPRVQGSRRGRAAPLALSTRYYPGQPRPTALLPHSPATHRPQATTCCCRSTRPSARTTTTTTTAS